MSIRSVVNELEAKLKASSGSFFSKSSGKLERKSYGDGAERLKISLRKLNVPDNSIAIVAADGQEIAQIVIQNGVGRIDNETSNSDALPELRAMVF